MVDKVPVFNILEDPATENGAPWHLVSEGDAVAAKNAGAVLAAKDPSNNLQYLSLDAQNRLIVNTEADDVVDLGDEGDNAGSATFVDLLTIVLQNSTVYKELEFLFSCFRSATFEIVHIDDVGGSPVETIRGTPKAGAGNFTTLGKLNSSFTSGATGVQHLIVRGINLSALSQLEAALSVKEVQ